MPRIIGSPLAIGFPLLAACSLSASAQADPDGHLAAVRTFADNVLAHGKDTYGPRHTPLFVDGLDVETRSPVRWKLKGQEWVLSNQASQQNLFRTLVALTRLTGESAYREAAVAAVRYQFEHLRAPNGLMYWGGHCAYDAASEQPVGERHGGKEQRLEHELKRHYLFYEFMWEVDPAVTKTYIEAFWGAHIVDWSNLCMNRHGRYDRGDRLLWDNEFRGGPVFFPCDGLTFVSTGSDLYCAAAMLSHLSGDSEPMAWARRMAERYVATRNPRTGLPGYQYTRYAAGDRAFKQFGPEWGERILEGTLLVPDLSVRQFGDASAAQLLLGEMLGAEGRAFTQWGLEDLAAYARHAYSPDDNTFAALVTDGTRLSPADVRRSGYFGPAGSDRFKPLKAGADLLRAYALAWRVSGDAAHWATARGIARGNELGDIGEAPGEASRLNVETSCAEPNALLAVLEIHEREKSPAYLKLARRIADNIIAQRFRNGFFVERPASRHAKFDSTAPLALLRLVATERQQPGRVPTIWPGKSYFHCDYDGEGRTYDNSVIYGR